MAYIYNYIKYIGDLFCDSYQCFQPAVWLFRLGILGIETHKATRLAIVGPARPLRWLRGAIRHPQNNSAENREVLG